MNRGRQYDEGVKLLTATSLPTLSKRAHVRVSLPSSVMVYARLRKAGSTAAAVRCVVQDISAGGVALTLTEGMRFELPGEGQEVHLDLDYDGGEASTRGVVVRTGAKELSVAFPPASRDSEVNVGVLTLIARVVTRRVEHLDHRRYASALRSRLLHESFLGAGQVEVRVQTAPPAWWQIVFLDYLVSWMAGGEVETGHIDRSFAAQVEIDAQQLSSNLVKHEKPWASLKKVAGQIAGRCASAQPDFAGGFASITRSL